MVYSYAPTINYMARPARANRKPKPEHGKRLVARRAELGLSLADIERDTDGVVYDQLLWRIENGVKSPDTLKLSQRAALSEVLKWSLEDLDTALGINQDETRREPSTSGIRLRELREAKDLTVEEAADKSNRSFTARRLKNLEERDGAWQKVTEAEVYGLALAFEMNTNDVLAAVNGSPYSLKPNLYADQASLINPNLRYGTRKIPKYSWVGLGPGGRDGEIIGYVDIPETWNGEFFSYDAKGDSMSPEIPDGTELVIKAQNIAEVNEVVLCSTPEEGTMLKQFAGVGEDGLARLDSFNAAHRPIWTRELTILGILWETRRAWRANGRRRK